MTDVNSDNVGNIQCGLIKISGKVLIQDYLRLNNTLKELNNITKAIAEMSNVGVKANQVKSVTNAKSSTVGDIIPKGFSKSFETLSKFFKGDTYEAYLVADFSDIVFNLFFNKEHFRISTENLLNLYGSSPVMNWIVTGQITYSSKDDTGSVKIGGELADTFRSIDSMGNQFGSIINGTNQNTVKIAPIAVYTETKV